jgi:uncharacterized membrane protein
MGDVSGYKLAVRSGIVLGIGLGGFADGILLHMILQWHHMISHRIPPDTMPAMEINMFWDGIFHVFTWIMCVVGIGLLWSAAKHGAQLPSTLSFAGWILMGAGGFNLVEGIIDHHLLQLHHVKELPDSLAWDVGFLALGGLLLIAVGGIMVRAGRISEKVPAPSLQQR